MADKKGLKNLYSHIDRMDINQPDILFLSGNDPDILEGILEKVRKRLNKEVGEYETTSFSGEPGDDSLLFNEIFNIPLFGVYRLIVVRQCQEIFKQMISGNGLKLLKENFKNIPDRTLMVMLFSGIPAEGFVKAFGEKLYHHKALEIYPNQLPMFIMETAHKLGLSLQEEALNEIRERVEPKEGAVSLALQRLKDNLPQERHHKITVQEVRDIIFPNLGMNAFALIDALFSEDRMDSERELTNFNESSDNLFGILKLILNRTDEIRKFRTGKKLNMNNIEMIDLLGLKNRPAFVQKKILERLTGESRRFNTKRLDRIYDFLISIQMEFKSAIPARQQMKIFQVYLLEIFLKPETG
ncbi:MAG: hypothetical protein OEZ34_00805 [Spirochaetia bacterium]|nr:hypothetical protein [Spirochaetia bacterium]